MGTDSHVVGRRVPRLESWDKVTGRARYTADLRPADALFATCLRSPYAHARVAYIDSSAAEQLPGVYAVVTHANAPEKRFNRANKWPGDLDFLAQDETLLTSVARHVGDRIAVVAAVDEDAAREALSLIRVEFEVLPAVFHVSDATQPEAPTVHEGTGNVAARVSIETGDFAKALASADLIFEQRYTTHAANQCPIEPHVCFTVPDDHGRITIFSSTQLPFTVQRAVANVLGLALDRVRLVKPEIGGGFGSKDELGLEALCTLLALRTGRAVYMEYTREEEFYHSHRHPATIFLTTGVRRDGTIVARGAKVLENTGAYASMGPKVLKAGFYHWAGLYPCADMRFEGLCVYTNLPPSGAFRGYGNPQVTFAMESQMDEIAAAIGIDPVELRLKNAVRRGDRHPLGFTVESCGLENCLKQGAEWIGFAEKRENPSAISEGDVQRGVGCACAIHVSGAQPSAPEVSSAVLRLEEDGTFTLLSGTAEIGTGTTTVLAQIAAEVLGIGVEGVHVVPVDTDQVPYDPGAYGSRTTFIAGGAAKLAAEDARHRLLDFVARDLDVPPQAVVCGRGRVYVASEPDRGLTFPEIARAFARSDGTHLVGEATYSPKQNAPPFAAAFAEVTVDVGTGIIRVDRLVLAQDAGVVINPLMLEGQMEGGAYQGLGYAISEELVFDPDTGRILNPDLMDYRLPTPADMPELHTIIVETSDPSGPFGAKGAGEIPLVPIAPAVANAVFNATGVRIRDLPLTPERVLRALRERSAAEQ